MRAVVDKAKEYRYAIGSSLIVGLLSYMYFFTNNLMGRDSPQQLFARGATLTSGRWGIDFLNKILPPFMMPWLNGITALLLMTAAVCLILEIVRIRNVFAQILFAGVFIAFPAFVSSLLFMFAAPVNALSLLLAVLSVWLFEKRIPVTMLLAVGSLVLSLSLYQAFFSFSLCLFMILLIQQMMDDDACSIKEAVRDGILDFAFVAVSLLLYFLITKLIVSGSHSELSPYATSRIASVGAIGKNAVYAYLAFGATLFLQLFGYVNTPMVMVLYVLLIVSAAIGFFVWCRQLKGKGKAIAVFFLLAVFPLAAYSLYVISGREAPTSMTQYSFYCCILLAWVFIKRLPAKFVKVSFAVVSLILVSYIYTSNQVALYEYQLGENMHSFYQSIVTQVKLTPGFDENSVVALVGKNYECQPSKESYVGIEKISGVEPDINYWSREYYINTILGFSVPFADSSCTDSIRSTDEFKQMPVYPYYGSIKKINQYIVVKLGE